MDYKCTICKAEGDEIVKIESHHIIPVSQGGDNSEKNKIFLCTDCHYKVHHPNWVEADLKQFKNEYKEGICNDIFSDGYGLLPRKIMCDKSLSATSKLIYVELSSLCAARGYCWATNGHLAKIFNLSIATVSDAIRRLEKYIYIEDRASFKRKIWVHILKNQPSRKLEGCHQRNLMVNLQEKAKHNNINNNNINNIETHISFLSKLPREVVDEFIKKFNVSEKQLIAKAESLLDWCEANGKQKKNYKAFLRNAIRKDFGERGPEDEEMQKRIKATLEKNQGSSEFAKSLVEKMRIKK